MRVAGITAVDMPGTAIRAAGIIDQGNCGCGFSRRDYRCRESSPNRVPVAWVGRNGGHGRAGIGSPSRCFGGDEGVAERRMEISQGQCPWLNVKNESRREATVDRCACFHRPFRTDLVLAVAPGTMCRANFQLSLPGRVGANAVS
jgi:hypothetical protein